jgi:hypothetical protein
LDEQSINNFRNNIPNQGLGGGKLKSLPVNTVIVFFIVLSFLTPNVFALQKVGREMTFSVGPGGSDTQIFMLINDENKTITATMGSEGEVADYLSMQEEVVLDPGERADVEVQAKLPFNYEGPDLLEGLVFAQVEGEGGGVVQINLRLGMLVKLFVTEPENPPSIIERLQGMLPSTMSDNPLVVLALVAVIGALIIGSSALIKSKRR